VKNESAGILRVQLMKQDRNISEPSYLLLKVSLMPQAPHWEDAWEVERVEKLTIVPCGREVLIKPHWQSSPPSKWVWASSRKSYMWRNEGHYVKLLLGLWPGGMMHVLKKLGTSQTTQGSRRSRLSQCTSCEQELFYEARVENTKWPNCALGTYTEGKVLRQKIIREIVHQSLLFGVWRGI